ncbi:MULTISPECIES: energy transducer TonB [unclassified Sulfuricurvum]|uniref:energy transducer TonB n=1 Tax=unclassified Sulfuricurvum TaxID=2632390 RepID=UPI0025D1F233|nr:MULTISPECIES: energy transducer TonB [unclassified Sulfuricurvum]
MKLKHSFLISVLFHAGLMTAAFALMILPDEEKEDEVVLELSLNTLSEIQTSERPTERSLNVTALKQTVKQSSGEPVARNIHEPAPVSVPHKSAPGIDNVPVQTVQPVVAVQADQPFPLQQPVVPKPQPPAPKSVNVEEQYMEDHLGTIRDILVKNRKYPNNAVRLRQEGNVKVSFRLKHNGEVEDIVIAGSSGYEILDEDAVALIRKTALYFPKPPKSVRITVPLSYTLKMRT